MEQESATLEDLLAHADWMRGLARRLVRDRDDADDLVQDAWLRALRAGPAMARRLRPWMATVILNLVRTRARGRTRARARQEALLAADPPPAPEELLARRQTERLLAQFVLALEQPYRRTILARFHDGKSSADIARDEGIPEGTVRWRLKSGLDELRRQLGAHEGAPAGKTRKRLGALLPLVGLSALRARKAAAATRWLGRVALFKGQVALTAAGAAVVLATATATVVVHRPPPPRPVPGAHAIASATLTAAPAAAPAPDPPAPPATLVPEATAAAPPPPPPIAAGALAAVPPHRPPMTTITGLVRDSRGLPAANVPVTMRMLGGSGTAERTTVTDEVGRFSYRLQPRSRIMLTAELPGEPAARLAFEVPTRSASLEAAADIAPVAASFGTIDVAVGAGARRLEAPTAKASDEPDAPLSRWCCHRAVSEGDVVYGRSCLRFDAEPGRAQSGCDLYGLRAKVSCHRYTRGGVSTGDLSRTERLDCDGRVL